MGQVPKIAANMIAPTARVNKQPTPLETVSPNDFPPDRAPKTTIKINSIIHIMAAFLELLAMSAKVLLYQHVVTGKIHLKPDLLSV